MSSFAETRAEFHRHAKELDVRLSHVRKSLDVDQPIDKRLQLRGPLEFLQLESANLLMCARLVDFQSMAVRLVKLTEAVAYYQAINEDAIESRCGVTSVIRAFDKVHRTVAPAILRVLRHDLPVIARRRSVINIGGALTPLPLLDVSTRKTAADGTCRLWFRQERGKWLLTTSISSYPNALSVWEGPFIGADDLAAVAAGLASNTLKEAGALRHG